MDGGKSWSTGSVINDVPGAPTEGLHTLAGDGKKGTLFAAWLDKRGGKGTKLYGARRPMGRDVVEERADLQIARRHDMRVLRTFGGDCCAADRWR